MATALPYWVSADMRHPYYVYTGLQDNGSWGGPSATRTRERHSQLRLVRHRRRRRFPDRRRSDRLQHRLHGVAGRQHESLRLAYRSNLDHSPARARRTRPRRFRRTRRSGRGGAPGAQAAPGAQGAEGARGGQGGQAGQRGTQPGAATEQETVTPQQQAGGAFGGRGGPPNVLNASPGDTYRFNWNTPFMLSPHNPSIVWLGGNRLFKSYNRGDTWVASADLTKNIDRNTVALMGVPGDRTQLSKNDGVVSYSTIISISESPVLPGVVWAGTDDGNVQVSRDSGVTFTEVGKAMPGPSRESPVLDLAHRRVAFRSGDRVRFGRRPSQRRHQAVSLRHARLRQELAEHREQPAGVGQHPGGSRGSEEQGSAVRRHRVRVVRVARRRQAVAALHEQPADCARRRHPRAPARQRSDRRDPCAQPVDRRRYLAAAADGVGRDRRTRCSSTSAPRSRISPIVSADSRPAGRKRSSARTPPRGTMISYYLKSAASGDVKITIADATGRTIRTIDGTKDQGINRVNWNLTPQPPPGGRRRRRRRRFRRRTRRARAGRSGHLHRHAVGGRKEDDQAGHGASRRLAERTLNNPKRGMEVRRKSGFVGFPAPLINCPSQLVGSVYGAAKSVGASVVSDGFRP